MRSNIISMKFILNYALLFSIPIILSVLGLIIFRIYKGFRSKSLVEESLEELEKALAELRAKLNDDSQFMRFSTFSRLQAELVDLRSKVESINNFSLRNRTQKLYGDIQAVLTASPSLREQVNERFYQQEKVRASHVFTDEKDQDLLTDEQLKAVLCDDDRNLIVAGAGSGKTRVIDFKVRYLVNYKDVSPSRILLLSFSKKSANDLIKKISQSIPGIEARTIHAFSSQVIGRHDKKLFDDSKKEFESYVIKALVQTLKEKSLYRLFDLFYKRYFSSLKPMIFYKTLNELRSELKKINSKLIDVPDEFGEIKARRTLKTLRGEFVRSVDERYIADYLYLQGIEYAYEPRYPVSDKTYYPDFYLVDYGIYIEHFAITETGRPPEYFDNPRKYMDGIEWKRALHKEKRTQMIESYSYLLNKGESSVYFRELLIQNGIEVKENLETDEVYTKISREFSRLFAKFYHTLKLSGLTLADLRMKFPEEKYQWFLQLFEGFTKHLDLSISKDNKIDFSDMIYGAITKYKENSGRTFEYIIVDEFQDTSNLAMKLLDEVYSTHPHSTLLSVGDDWQSIYGFNGSDVTIFSDYVKKYSGVSVQNLNSNFRSHSKIVNLGKKFISKNPSQIKKDVISRNRFFKDSEIGFLGLEQMDEKIRVIPDHESIFILYRYNDDCPVALGMFKDYFNYEYKKPIRKANCKKNISMMTIHASKGLEAQHVFVLFPDGIKRKFPSEIEDHFIFDVLKTNSDSFPFAEERRLMYVAITRAEQNLYFVSQNRDPNSVFWDELKDLARL